MKNLRFGLGIIIILNVGNISAIAQSETSYQRILQDTYNRALKYNDRAEAKSALYSVIAMNPQNDSLMTTLAYFYFDARQYASCVLICMDALSINPDNIAALEMSAISYENLGLKDKALDNFEKMYLKSDEFQVLYKMATLQYDLEKYLQCSTNVDILLSKPEVEEGSVTYTIDEVEKDIPVKAVLLNMKGLSNKELGNADIARQSFEEALKIAPEFIFAQENLDSLN